jgi:ComF family protein
MNIITPYLADFWKGLYGLFFPNLCIACQQNTPQPSVPVCTTCENNLSLTHFHQQKENAMMERFWGRVRIEYAASFYYFSKNSVIQELMHALKYQHKAQIGVMLGEWYGHELKDSPFAKVDYIIPVPLHFKRFHERGYNQSEMIAKGLSNILGIPYYSDILIRSEYTETQTKKSRSERFDNVKDAFQIEKSNLIEGKHILLIDDILTTGATLEACAFRVLEIPNTKVSILTIAMAVI